MHKLRIAVIGVGHLGRHHARILAGMPDVELVGVADSDPARCAEVAAQCGVPAYEDYRALVQRVDAASIVVPTSGHCAVASAFLGHGKSVLVEKPLAPDVAQAEELVRLARKHGAILQVGHIERFNPVLGAIAQPAQPPRFIEARRIGPYSFRSTDIGVVLDLMIHDLDIVLWLLGQAPERIAASAWSVFGGHEDVAAAHLTFQCGTVVQLLASRAGLAPRREMSIWWTDSFASLDFASGRSITSVATPDFHRDRARLARPQPQEIPALRHALRDRFFQVTERDWSGGPELLACELQEFISCVRTGREPLVNGQRGRDAIALAAAVLESAAQQPAPLSVPRPRIVADAA